VLWQHCPGSPDGRPSCLSEKSRKMRSFHARQPLFAWTLFVVSANVTAGPHPRGRPIEQAEATHVRRVLFPSRGALRPCNRCALPDLPPAQPRLARPAPAAASRSTAPGGLRPGRRRLAGYAGTGAATSVASRRTPSPISSTET
jgi:hypothetical protein